MSRESLHPGLAALSLLLLACTATAGEKALMRKTYTYKTVDAVEIQVDVYRPDDDRVRPVVAWLHGGALIVGHRDSVPKRLLELCRTEGYSLVSFDYRLAPEVKLPAIAQDVEDAFRWLREQGPKALQIDPNRLVITGGSAGGYLTLLCGVRLKPRPTALVAYWGYGDVDGDWFTRPSEHYRTQVPLVSPDELRMLRAVVGTNVLTGTGKDLAIQKARSRYYLYLRQNGLWPREVTGFDPATARAKLDPFCPVRHVTPSFPPTLLLHGTVDTDVPYELSAAMAKELTRHGVPHELVTVPGAGHGLAGGDPQRVEEANSRALAFIRKHLNTPATP